MARARWWICGDCRSLNDLPANKCYKCRAVRPANPTLIDDEYAAMGGPQQRVGISVELSKIAELSARDAREGQKGSGLVEAFAAKDDQPIESARAVVDPKTPPPPLREPVKRGIAAVGGLDWRRSLRPPLPKAPPPITAPLPPGTPMMMPPPPVAGPPQPPRMLPPLPPPPPNAAPLPPPPTAGLSPPNAPSLPPPPIAVPLPLPPPPIAVPPAPGTPTAPQTPPITKEGSAPG